MQLSLPSTENLPPSSKHNADASLADEAQYRYLHYAMSVITSRALPDSRDGLKPVQRRILYAMFHDQKLLPTAKHRKCASVVGDVLGKYHPHGDASVYEALVRMAQDFSLRMPLIDGHGNFGSQDGDAAAAYRYTECRLRPFALELLQELDQETVPFRPTFDGMRTEPTLFPARLPHLLINGTQGIAVGMATSIPPHNPAEIIDACLVLLENKAATTSDLLKKLKGPDFPTHGEILSTRQQLHDLYETGHGSFRLRGEYRVEQATLRGPIVVVITSIPYGITRASILEKLGSIVLGRHLPQLLHCRDESTDEVRIVLELKSGTDPHLVMEYLFRHTSLQTNVHMNFTCLVPSENPEICVPKQISLREALQIFLNFRMEVITKRAQHQLEGLEKRAHLLDGFVHIYHALDETLAIIRRSKGKSDAAKKLMERFSIDADQVEAILELKLYRLARLEINLIETERAEKEQACQSIRMLLSSEEARWTLIQKELSALRAVYSEKRRSRMAVPAEETSFDLDKLTIAEDTYVVLSKDGWIKRMGTIKDIDGIRVREQDRVQWIVAGSTKSTIVVFTNRGSAYTCRIADLPASTGYGEPLQKLFAFADQEKAIALFCTDPRSIPPKEWLLFVSQKGRGARARLDAFSEPSTRRGRRCFRLQPEDTLLSALPVSEQDFLSMVSIQGRVLACQAKEVPALNSPGHGVRMMRLEKTEAILVAQTALPISLETDKGKIITISKHADAGARGGKGKALISKGFFSSWSQAPLGVPILPALP